MPKGTRRSGYNLNTNFVDVATGNTYSSAAQLVLWMRMTPGVPGEAGLPGAPTDDGPYSLSPLYENLVIDQPTSKVKLGNNTYDAATFSNVLTFAAEVTSTAGHLSFSSAGDHGVPTATSDRPFSVSQWLKLTGTTAGSQNFFGKLAIGDTIDGAYKAWLTAVSGDIIFELYKTDGAGALIRQTTDVGYGDLLQSGWNHLAFTYDGRGGVLGYEGMKIYVNGVVVASTGLVSGTYTGMSPDWNQPLYVGASSNGSAEFDGPMAEFAVWAAELSAEEIRAIYNATKTGSTIFERSGYLNNPPRTILRDLDARRGSYPQTGRTTGRPESLAGKRAPFDDSNAFDLVDPYASATIEFNNLPAGDRSVLRAPTAMATVGGVRRAVPRTGRPVVVPDAAGPGPFFIVIEDSEGKGGQFEFKTNNHQVLAASSVAVDVANIPQGEIRKRVVELRRRIESAIIPNSKYREIDPQRLRRRALAEFAAKQFAAAVNKQNSLTSIAQGAAGIKITAIADGNKVHLRQQIPGASGHTPIALTVNGSSPPSDFKVLQQFKGGDSSELIYPLGISSQYLPAVKRLGYLVATPNLVTTGAVDGTAISAPGIARHSGPDLTGLFAQSLSPTIEPFVDSRLLLDPNDEFYDHGIDPDQAEGFSSPLGDKVAIVIDLNPVEPTQFGYPIGNDRETGANIFAGRPFHPVVYYNFDNQKWEGIRGINNNIMDGADVNQVEVTLDEFPIAFSRGVELNADGLKSACRPTTTFGFPFHPKFHATGSMTLKLSDYIDAPFVFEKYVLEFSGSYSGGSNYGFINNMYVYDRSKSGKTTTNVNAQFDNGEAWGGNADTSALLAAFDPQYTDGLPRAAINSFFIMKQTPSCAYDYTYSAVGWTSVGVAGAPSEPVELTITGSVPGYFGITPGNGNELTYVDTQRDLVTYGQWVSYAPPPGGNGAYLSQLPFTTMTGALEQGLGRELNVQDTGTSSPYWPGVETSAGLSYRFVQPSPTGSFVLKGKVKRPPALKVTGSLGSAGSFPFWEGTATSLSSARQIYTFNNGTRSGRSQDISDSRSLIKGTAGQVLGPDVNDFSFNLNYTTQPGSFKTREVPTHEFDDTSPYVLMPEDSLVFGWQSPLPYAMPRVCSYPRDYGAGGTDKYAFNSHTYGALPAASLGRPGSGPNTTISPGKGRLILYGSLIRENKEVPHSLDQKLTSDAIHEAVGNDPIFDQFDVEYSGQFTNTTSDAVITGSMKSTDDGQGPLGARGVAATFTAGNMGTTGSLQRTMKHTDSLERYYDTLTGLPEDYHMRNVDKMTWVASPASVRKQQMGILWTAVAPSNPDLSSLGYGYLQQSSGVDCRWLKAFPFENHYKDVKRSLPRGTQGAVQPTIAFGGTTLDNPLRPVTHYYFDAYYTSNPPMGGNGSQKLYIISNDTEGTSFPGLPIVPTDIGVTKFYFGFGDNVSGSVDFEKLSSAGSHSWWNARPRIRGFKYGLIGIADIRTDCIFRRDRYGQFRDMLEQRQGGRFFNVDGDVVETGRKSGLNESAVNFLFVNSGSGDPVAPVSTDSSNLSLFATSSLPYFEGTARNR